MKLLIFAIIALHCYLCNAQVENPCTIDTSHQFFLHPTDPQRYIQCSAVGTMFIRECPPRLVFSIEKQRCDRRQPGTNDRPPVAIFPETNAQTTRTTTTSNPIEIPSFTPMSLAPTIAPRVTQANFNNQRRIQKFSPATTRRTTTTTTPAPVILDEVPQFISEQFQDDASNVIPQPFVEQFDTTPTTTTTTTRLIPTRPRTTLRTTKPTTTTTTTLQPQFPSIQRTPGEICDSIQISGSKMGLVNGFYSRIEHNDPINLPMYERKTGARRTVIAPLSDMWCLSLNFGFVATSELSPSLVESRCQTRQCCLLVSDMDDKDLTDPERVWLANNIVNGGEDLTMQISCTSQPSLDVLSAPQTQQVTTRRTTTVAVAARIELPIEQQPIVSEETNLAPTIESSFEPERVNSLTSTFRFVPINTCKMVSCGEQFRCASRRSCSKCNPACFPIDDIRTESMIKITCSNVNCPTGTLCALDENDNSLKCVLQEN